MADQLTVDEMKTIIERDLGKILYYTTKGTVGGGDPCVSVLSDESSVDLQYFSPGNYMDMAIQTTISGVGPTHDDAVRSLFQKLATSTGDQVALRYEFATKSRTRHQYDPDRKAFFEVTMDEDKNIFVPVAANAPLGP